MQVQRYPESYIIEQYLGITLTEENKYIFASPDDKKLIAVSNQKKKEQTKLFLKVISRLEMDDVELLLTKYEFSSKTVVTPAELITSIFLDRLTSFPKNEKTTQEEYYKYHSQNLASALNQHQKRHFTHKSFDLKSSHPSSVVKVKVPLITINSEPPSLASNSRSSRSSRSDSISQSPPSSLERSFTPNSSPKFMRKRSESDSTPHSPRRKISLSPRIKKETLEPIKDTPLALSFENQEDSLASAFLKGLTSECLDYCQILWLYKIKRFRNVDTVNNYQTEVNEKELELLKKNEKFNNPQNFINLLQERVIKILDPSTNTILIPDLYRLFHKAIISDSDNNILFKYEASKEKLNPFSKHDCSQFENFLIHLIKLFEGIDNLENHPILNQWKSCVIETLSHLESNLFIETCDKFIKLIKNTSLYTLLYAFQQAAYMIPSHAIPKAIPKDETLSYDSDTAYDFRYISNTLMEVHIYNTVEISMESGIVKFKIETILSRNPLPFEPWYSKIHVHASSEMELKKKYLRKKITKPLEKIGLTLVIPKSEGIGTHSPRNL